MKKNQVFLAMILVSFVTIAAAQTELPRQQSSTKNHIKVVTVKNGVTEVLDTTIFDGKSDVLILKGNNHFTFSGSGEPAFEWEETFGDDSTKKIVVIRQRPDGNENRKMVTRLTPNAPIPPITRDIRFLNHRSGNVIELSDPGIISYKKKKLSGGREKIIIIRNEEADKKNEEIIYKIDSDKKMLHFETPKPSGELEIKQP